MASGMQQMLRRFCFGTEWKYAFFWNLKHRVLTLDDAYYDINEQSDSSEIASSTESMKEFYNLPYLQDPLLLALEKLSCYVYSLGQGIVGQVAITGKYRWISSDDYDFSSRPSDNDCDLWQTQFQAGIKTVVVVAILPYGVLQLGSLQKVDVDLTLLTHFRDAFQSVQGSLVQHQMAPCCTDNSGLPNPEKYIQGDLSNIQSSASSFPNHMDKSCTDLHWDHQPNSSENVQSNGTDEARAALRFSTISELHEALGPVFQMNTTPPSVLEDRKTEARSVEMFGSHLTSESCEEHLLEAIVAKVCNEKSTLEYPLNGYCTPVNTVNQGDYSLVHADMEENGVKLNFSDSTLFTSSSAISCPRSGLELLENNCVNPVKSGRKRARAGESRRPRPRDRQQIQDRLKELRELVPNGSKCSIDSLLEKTVRHLNFLESVTKHADNLSRCTKSASRHHSETSKEPTNYDQGSSWAVEVGSQLKVHSITVENLSKEGQLLIEMLCENGGVFLEIAEAMRSLGLTVLKGATEPQGEKIWICFVVEGDDTSRMDILWSLVQILQLKTSSQT